MFIGESNQSISTISSVASPLPTSSLNAYHKSPWWLTKETLDPKRNNRLYF